MEALQKKTERDVANNFMRRLKLPEFNPSVSGKDNVDTFWTAFNTFLKSDPATATKDGEWKMRNADGDIVDDVEAEKQEIHRRLCALFSALADGQAGRWLTAENNMHAIERAADWNAIEAKMKSRYGKARSGDDETYWIGQWENIKAENFADFPTFVDECTMVAYHCGWKEERTTNLIKQKCDDEIRRIITNAKTPAEIIKDYQTYLQSKGTHLGAAVKGKSTTVTSAPREEFMRVQERFGKTQGPQRGRFQRGASKGKPFQKDDKSRRPGSCNYCQKEGHWAKECRKRLREQGQDRGQQAQRGGFRSRQEPRQNNRYDKRDRKPAQRQFNELSEAHAAPHPSGISQFEKKQLKRLLKKANGDGELSQQGNN
jgi:hypothetical protein